MSDPRFSCGGCTNRWDGYNTCHCAGCHRTFSSINSFDIHQVKGACVDPATLVFEKGKREGQPRLVLSSRAYECWSQPGSKPLPGTPTLGVAV